jgi:hypothetical protein
MYSFDLRLELRSGGGQSLPGTADLAALLVSASHDPAARTALETAAGGSLAALLPTDAAATTEPDWLRADEMLGESAVCPGERLLASSLATVATWSRPGDLRDAALQLALVLAARAEKHLAAQCQDLARMAALVPPAERVRLAV